MQKPITVNIPHKLGRTEARRRLQDGFTSMQQNKRTGLASLISLQERWEGDCLHFEAGSLGQKMRGRVDVRDDAVQIQVDVPELLALFADRLLGVLKTGTQKLLE